MLKPGVYARPGVRNTFAVDLGTSRVRIWTPERGLAIDQPSTVAYDMSGQPAAVGQAAVDLAAGGEAALVWPLRSGVVVNTAACEHLLRGALTIAGMDSDEPSLVLVGVPATATRRQQMRVIRTIQRAAAGSRVVSVEEPLAAALACRVALDRAPDLVVVDIGHGRTEVARISAGTVTDAERVTASTALDQIPATAEVVRRICRAAAPPGRPRLLMTGGGAATPGAAARLAALTGRPVTMPDDVRAATITGLSLLLTA